MARQMKVVVLLVFIAVFACDACKYRKFTPKHSYCLPPNRNCDLLDTGVTDAEKQLIVRQHNEYRQRVATGRENAAGGLPTAANMMEMEWDDELAAVAQKYAEQCKFQHDCNKCRQVDRFGVGQNIFIQFSSSMSSGSGVDQMVKSFYDEVSMFDKSYISPFVFGSYGHFTQVVWATSSKVGCGKSVYKEGGWYKTLVVCNYGPGGNMMGGEMYKAGSPCSQCPSGSSCSSNYRGLCK